MTPNQARAQRGNPDNQNPDANTLRTRLTFQAHGIFRAARKTVRVIRHLRVSSPA
ncbi:hypothetical protein [Streptomyces sp900116325]|uniref:hypothetical protein n=1 Tax=Streptomyces sp. 900116325 TaxID=3154295 RepID=UPI0033257822